MTPKRKASEVLKEPNTSRAMVKAMVKLGRIADDCGVLQDDDDTAPEVTTKVKKSADIVQLPLWPEATRGTPNSFLRGALFAAIQGKEREYLNRQMLASREGIKIRFTGMQLDQSDLDVWKQAAELARSHPLGNVCHFHIHGFLKALGRNTGKRDHEWLKEVFSRLTASCVEITHGRYTYGGSLLEFTHDEKDSIYVLSLNKKILYLL